MTLARLDEVLAEAVAGSRGVGAFNVIQLEHAEALVAAVAAGLDSGSTWHRMVQDAVTWSAAAVLQPIAGEIDPDDVARLAPQVLMESR